MQYRLIFGLTAALPLSAACSSKSDAPVPSAGQSNGGAGASGALASGGSGGALAGSSGSSGTSLGGAGGSAGNAGAAGAAAGGPGNQSSVLITSRFPAVAGTACADAPLRLSFSAPVNVGTAGKIQVFKTSAPSTPVDVIDLAVAPERNTIGGRPFYRVRPIFIEGTDAVIYFKNKAIAEPGAYFVTVDAGVFVDGNQQPLPAVTGADAWPFTTVAPEPADPTQLMVARESANGFCTVQGAVDYVPAANMTPTTISIAKGTYHEVVYIAAKHNLTFHGEDRKTTVIAYPNNDTLQMKLGTAYRAMVEAEGSNGLVFANLTLHNTTPQGGSQAEALRIEPGDKAILRDADFISTQDTLLLTGRVFVSNSYVEGNVDFIWGKGTAYFDKSEIKTVGRVGYLVQSRNGLNYGYVFVDSTLSTSGAVTNGTLLARIEGDRFPASNVAFVNCKLGSHIAPKGWLITNSTGNPVASLDLTQLKFWEYQSTDLDGAPLDVTQRDPASRQITASEAATLRDKATVLAGWDPSL